MTATRLETTTAVTTVQRALTAQTRLSITGMPGSRKPEEINKHINIKRKWRKILMEKKLFALAKQKQSVFLLIIFIIVRWFRQTYPLKKSKVIETIISAVILVLAVAPIAVMPFKEMALEDEVFILFFALLGIFGIILPTQDVEDAIDEISEMGDF